MPNLTQETVMPKAKESSDQHFYLFLKDRLIQLLEGHKFLTAKKMKEKNVGSGTILGVMQLTTILIFKKVMHGELHGKWLKFAEKGIEKMGADEDRFPMNVGMIGWEVKEGCMIYHIGVFNALKG